MVKMSDVAKVANVSTATVSRVIQGSSSVREKTRKRVLDAIEQLDYQPNILARHFRRTETRTVLVVVPNITNTVFSQMVGGIDLVATQNGYQVLLGNTGSNKQKAHDYIDHLKQKQVDGMILLTAELDQQVLSEIARQYPVVLTSDYIEGTTIPTVSIDNINSGRKATEHLIKLGHRRIAHISGSLDILMGRDRLKGYQQALEQHNIEQESEWICEGDFSFKSGYNEMIKLISLEKPPTAVFAASDEMAMGAIKAAKDCNLHVPGNLAVIGFDNISFSAIFEPAITTVAQPMFEMGKKSMEMLLERMSGESLTTVQCVLKSEIIIRESCGYKHM